MYCNVFCSVKEATPRVLINREKCNQSKTFMCYGSAKFDFDSEKAYRWDVLFLFVTQVLDSVV